jgi:uncharacterized protein
MTSTNRTIQAHSLDSPVNSSLKAWVTSWVKRHPIIAMVALVYLLAWPFLITLATDSYGLTHFNLSPLFNIPTGFAPAIAAFVVTAIVGGKEGLRELLRKTLRWRVGWQWYLVALFIPAVMHLAGTAIYGMLTGQWLALPVAQMTVVTALVSFSLRLVIGALINTEEVAWRGFALPRLQSHLGALRASLVLWIPWTLLHLPYFFIKDNAIQQEGPIVFALRMLTMTIIFTYLFNNTRGSILICTLLHAALNSWPQLLMASNGPSLLEIAIGLTISYAIVIVLILRFGSTHLSHKQDSEKFVV